MTYPLSLFSRFNIGSTRRADAVDYYTILFPIASSSYKKHILLLYNGGLILLIISGIKF